jgi:hypothetical protein
MKVILYALITMMVLVKPLVIFAHEGHGHENPLSPGHYIANPEHFIPLALTVVAAVAFVVVHLYLRKKKLKGKLK